MGKIIRDTIHGYIHLSKLEELLTVAPIFLRLKNIHQNATAHLTYPSLHVDRYVHSLGTMELAGKIIQACLINTPREVKKDFLKECSEIGINSEAELIYLVRLVGLLHDIGHLPFSHLSEGVLETLETAVEELYGDDKRWVDFQKIYIKEKRPKIHEFATLRLIETDASIKRAFELCDMEKFRPLLLKTLKERTGIFKTLHDIIDCEIDADRGDYLLRDGLTSGIGFGQYDILRLIESMRLYPNNITKDFYIRPTISALSTVEAFLLERYKLYRWLYHHQHVVLTDTILAKLLRNLITYTNELPLGEFLRVEDFHYKKYYGEDGYFFDEIEIWNRLRKCFYKCNDMVINGKITDDIKLTFTLLKILLYRKKLAKALWKNYLTYTKFAEELKDHIVNKTGNRRETIHEGVEILRRFAEKTVSPLKSKKLADKLEEKGFLVLGAERTNFRPVELRDKELIVSEYKLIDENESKLVPITSLSILVRNLPVAWLRDLQFYVFLVSFNEMTDRTWTKSVRKCREEVKEVLAESYDVLS